MYIFLTPVSLQRWCNNTKSGCHHGYTVEDILTTRLKSHHTSLKTSRP